MPVGAASFEEEVEKYLRHALREAQDDVMPFGSIVDWGKNKLRLNDSLLRRFVVSIVQGLLEAGVHVIRPIEKADGYDWEVMSQYASGSMRDRIQRIIRDSYSFDPETQYFAWFAFDVPESRWPKVEIRNGVPSPIKPRGDA